MADRATGPEAVSRHLNYRRAATELNVSPAAVASMRKGGQRQRLIVSVEPSFATAWLVPRLEGFRTLHWAPWLARVGAARIKPGVGLRFGDCNLALLAAIAGQGVILGSTPILRSLMEAGLSVNPFAHQVSRPTSDMTS